MIRIVLADDSAFFVNVLKDTLASVKDFSIIGVATNGKEAVELVRATKPDVLILDCEMPVMNGLEALKIIMRDCPVPVFMLSSLTSEGSAVTIKALEYGAFDFLLKPVTDCYTLDTVATELVQKIRFVAMKGKFARLSSAERPVARVGKSFSDLNLPVRKIDIIAMGSSTGGVQAAIRIISKLPKGLPPIVWVQHMPQFFTKNFADRLDSLSGLHVKEAEDGEEIKKGVCYLARGGIQMELKSFHSGYKIKMEGTEKVSGHCPSCNVLFNSVAQYFSENALGVILTGMGDDGALGLTAMHDHGAYVIGQDERSSVVYGMPKAAYKAGAVDVQLGVDEIATGITRVVGK